MVALSKGVVVCALIVVVSYWCAASVEEVAEARRVTYKTTPCGDASGTSGEGVAIRDGVVLTAAHPVFGAGSVSVSLPDGSRETGEVAFLDLGADLALLRVDGVRSHEAEFGLAGVGDEVFIAGAPSMSRRATVAKTAEIRIEEVGSSRRISRLGYELDVVVNRGDSGSGVYDGSGRLIGIIFGRNPDGGSRTFVTGQAGLHAALAASTTARFTCDPGSSRVVLSQ